MFTIIVQISSKQQLWSFNLSNFSQHDSKSENQGDFKPSIEDVTYIPYKVISLKQLDNFYGKRKSFFVTKSLTTIWQFTSL